MKKYSIAITIIALSTASYAQNHFPATGSVGIGTLTPPNVPGYSGLIFNSPGYGGLIEFQQSGNSKAVITGNDTGMYLMGSAGRQLYFWTDGNEKMRILTNGYIGMGYQSPSSRLEVASPVGSFGSSGTFHTTGSQSWGHVLSVVSDHSAGDDPRLLFSYRANSKHWSLGGSANTSRFGIWEDGGDGVHGSGFGTERFTVLPGGNVGIGISLPAEKLAVNGNVRAREVKVENTNWPDYVFKSDYKLLSLQSISQYIKVNGHLPGIPSAAEVKRDGIHVGEMNATLVKKIEELTLYLIKQEQEIRNLKSEIRTKVTKK